MRKLFQSKADANGRYRGENGSYNAATNTIRLDVNAGAYNAGELSQVTLLRTMSHELTHALQQNSPAQYEALKNAVLDVLTSKSGASIEEMAARKMEQDSSLKKADVALDEVVAEACENMLRDSDAMEQLIAQHPAEAKTFLEKVKQFFTDIVNAIRAAFGGSDTSRSREATALMQQAEEYLDICEKWSKALQDTAEISGRMDRQTGDGDVSERFDRGNEDIRYSLRETDDGRKVAVVDNDILQDIYDGRWTREKEKQAKAAARNALKKFNRVYVNNVETAVNRRTRDEYGGSQYTEDIWKSNKKVFADKMRFADVMDDVVTATVGWKNDGILTHDRTDKFVDFVKGDVLLASGDRKYSARVVVGITRGGKYVLYDITSMEPANFNYKKTDLPPQVKRNDPRHWISGAPVNTNVAPSDGSVKYSLRENDRKYMDAVEQGDTAEAERMVSEMAEKTMEDSQVRIGEDGNPDPYLGKLMPVYHATDNQFTIFDKGRFGDVTDFNASDEYIAATSHLGFWFNTQDLKGKAGSNSVKAYLNLENIYNAGSLENLATEIENIWDDNLTVSENAQAYLDALQDDGYDGISIEDEEYGGISYVAFEPSQIKSADAVTYDDNGNVIPLSERFNSENDDIRYQMRDDDDGDQGLVGIFDEAPRLEEAHIDQRTWDNMSDRRVHSFMNDYPASRIWLARMASVLQSDVAASTAGQRFMNEEGTFMGQKRDTTPLLAEMKDSGYTWQQMSDVFGKMAEVFENGDLEVKVPETAIWKRAELILDRAVTEGYTDMNGIEYRPDAGYMRYKDELPGAKAREIPANAVNDTFEDVDNRLAGGGNAAAQTGGDGERVQLQGDTSYQEKQQSAKSGIALMDGGPSNRELLSSALESAAQTPEELRYVQSYKKQAQKIAEMEGLLVERRAEVQQLQNMKKRTADQEIRMKNLQTSIAETESMIDKRDKGLLKMEAMEPLRNVLDRERANYRETLKQAKKDAAARQREKDAAKLDNALLATQMHEGREWAAKLHEAENRVAEANQKVEDLKAQSLADRMHESSEWAAKLRKAENQLATAKRQLETAQMQRIAERMAEGRKWANEKLLKTITISRSFGTPSGARTLDTLIKSQVLYQLS